MIFCFKRIDYSLSSFNIKLRDCEGSVKITLK